MRLLTLAFVSPHEFLSHFRDKDGTGLLFARTRAALAADQTVLMEISFPGLPNRALLRGSVAEERPGVGAWIRIHPDDAPTRSFLVALAAGELQVAPTVNRSFERYPAAVPVACRVERPGREDEEQLVSRTADVSAGGAFVRSLAPPPIGSRLRLDLGPLPGIGTVSLDGHVAWIGPHPGGYGFGVRFQDKRRLDARALRSSLRRASETGRVELFEAAS